VPTKAKIPLASARAQFSLAAIATATTRATTSATVTAAALQLAPSSAARRLRLARDVATLISRLSPEGATAKGTAGQVDFPDFVAGLLNGVFDAVVNSSVQQMDAYAALVANVAKAAEKFAKDNVDSGAARDYLSSQFPDFTDSGSSPSNDDDPRKRKRRVRKTKAQHRAETRRLLMQLALFKLKRKN
jgi:hypothetical protein